MQQREKFVFICALLLMYGMLGAASNRSNEVSLAVFGESLEDCAEHHWIEVPGQRVYYDFVFAHNKQRSVHDHAEFAMGILSGPDELYLSACRSALIEKLENVRSSQVRLSSLDVNPFFVHKRMIVHDVDVVEDFELPLARVPHKVDYSIAFPHGPDMACHPFVITPHQQNYILRLAHDSDLYKDREEGKTLLSRIYGHAQRLCIDATGRNDSMHVAPIIVVDPCKLASIMLRNHR